MRGLRLRPSRDASWRTLATAAALALVGGGLAVTAAAAATTGSDPEGPASEPGTTAARWAAPNTGVRHGLLLDTVADAKRFDEAGQRIGYSFVVTNEGKRPLRDVVVTDDLTRSGASSAAETTCEQIIDRGRAKPCDRDSDGDSGSKTDSGKDEVTLAPGASAAYSGTYKVTEKDLDRGVITNLGRVTAELPDGKRVHTVDGLSLVAEEPGELTVGVTASQEEIDHPGRTVTYRYTVSNETAGDLTEVAVASELNIRDEPLTVTCVRPQKSCKGATLPSLATGKKATFKATFTVSQTDFDASDDEIVNTATVTAKDENDEQVTGVGQHTLPVVGGTGVRVVKYSRTTKIEKPGQKVTYRFKIANVGWTTLKDVEVTDVQVRPASQENLTAVDCPDRKVIRPTKTMTCTADYRVTQADVAHGSVSDTVIVRATSSRGRTVRTSAQLTLPVAGTTPSGPPPSVSPSATPTTGGTYGTSASTSPTSTYSTSPTSTYSSTSTSTTSTSPTSSPTTADGSDLPETGNSVSWPLLAAGLVAVGLGISALLVWRRRRSS